MDDVENVDTNFLLIKSFEESVLHKKAVFTDLILKSSDGFEYHVHKIILAGASQFFKSLLLTTDDKPICINEIDCPINGESLKDILEYIYTGQYNKTVSSIKDAINLYEISIYFQLEILKHFAIYSLSKIITCETSLTLYRYALKNQITDLADNCIIFMVKNYKEMFKNFLDDFIYEELDAIISNPNLIISHELLYLNIIKWIKCNYDKRQCYLKDLLENVNFSLINDEFKKNYILSDSILFENNDFIYKIINDFKNTLRDGDIEKQNDENNFDKNLNQSKLKKNNVLIENFKNDIENEVTIFKKNKAQLLLIVGNYGIMKLNKKSLFHKISSNNFSMQNGFTTVPFSSDLILLGGDDTSVCKIYVMETDELVKLPKMIHKRKECEGIILNDKLYACGGNYKTASMEEMDIKTMKWTSNISMLEQKNKFGLVEYQNSIYAFGGLQSRKLIPSNCVERYDPRMNCWTRINMKNSITLGITKSLTINNDIFCYTSGGGHLFDVRQNQWHKDFSCSKPFNYELIDFSLVQYGKDIIVAGYIGKYINKFIQYNINENSWTNINCNYQKKKPFKLFAIRK